jgi:hypothetical protein
VPSKPTLVTYWNNQKKSPTISILRRLLAAEIYPALGISGWRRIFAPLFWLPFHLFAKLGWEFDQRVCEDGFRGASAWVLSHFGQEISLDQNRAIPAHGPLLIAANHPGTVDALAIATQLPRDDLKVVADPIPFLAALPHTAQHMIFTDRKDASARMTTIRKALRHLKAGGALLIFPSGHLDPDPAIFPEAVNYLDDWSRSLEFFLRRAPETSLQLAILSGVLSPKFGRAWIIRRGQDVIARHRIAEILQIIYQLLFPQRLLVSPKISLASPQTMDALLARGQENIDLLAAIIAAAKELFQQHAQTHGLPLQSARK